MSSAAVLSFFFTRTFVRFLFPEHVSRKRQGCMWILYTKQIRNKREGSPCSEFSSGYFITLSRSLFKIIRLLWMKICSSDNQAWGRIKPVVERYSIRRKVGKYLKTRMVEFPKSQDETIPLTAEWKNILKRGTTAINENICWRSVV